MILTGKAGYMDSIGNVPTKSEQKQIIHEHKLKQMDKENISAIKISTIIIGVMITLAMILS